MATLVIIACVVLFLYMACLCRCREDKAQKLNLILGRRPPQISVLQYIFICSTFLLVKFTWVWWRTAIGVGGMSRLERESLGNSASPATSNLRLHQQAEAGCHPASYIRSPKSWQRWPRIIQELFRLHRILWHYFIKYIYCVTTGDLSLQRGKVYLSMPLNWTLSCRGGRVKMFLALIINSTQKD